MTEKNEYACRAYRSERYVAFEYIEADTPEDAMKELKRRDDEGNLDFEEYAGHAEASDYFVVELGNQDNEELTEQTLKGRLDNEALGLFEAARLVVKKWEKGDLAGSVTILANFVKVIEGEKA